MGLPLLKCGDVFNRYTVVRRAPDRGGKRYWECRCACGTLRVVADHGLRYGQQRSCGCLRREAAAEALRRNATTHGMSGTSEYNCWVLMRKRCYNPKDKYYADYGGRGITVCEAWRESFEAFFAAMGRRPSRRHSIERLDNQRGYDPGNCVWGTPEIQARNRRSTHFIEAQGERLCLREWSVKIGIPESTIFWRLRHGYSDAQAITTPITPRSMRRVACHKLL